MGAVITLDGDIALVPSNSQPSAVNTYTGDHMSVAGDLGALARMNKATANTFTIAPNSSVPCPVPCVQYVEQAGAGATTIAGGAGVTVNGVGGSLTIGAQYTTVTLLQVAADAWIVTGIPLNTGATGPLTGTTLDYQTLTLHSPNGSYSSTLSVSNFAHLIFAQDTMRFNSSSGGQYIQIDGNGVNVFVPMINVPVLVSQLPAASSANAGARMFVTDANSTTFGAAAVGGGSNQMPVFAKTTGWFIG